MVPLISAPKQRKSLYFSLFAGNSRGERVNAKTVCFPRGRFRENCQNCDVPGKLEQLAASRRRGAVARAQEEVCSAGLRIQIETDFFFLRKVQNGRPTRKTR
jgi:hypothetical protein